MTVTPETTETPAVQIALQEYRRDIMRRLDDCMRRAARNRLELAADDASIAGLENELAEIEAALAGNPNNTTLTLADADAAKSYVRAAKVPAVIALQPDGVPALLWIAEDEDRVVVQTPEFGSVASLALVNFPLTVVQP